MLAWQVLLGPEEVTPNDLEPRNGRYSPKSVTFRANYVTLTENRPTLSKMKM